MIGEGVIAFTAKQTITQIAEASHAHPTLTEAIKEACLAALGRSIHV
jgi:dihydrolipoamide dehydrogenase